MMTRLIKLLGSAAFFAVDRVVVGVARLVGKSSPAPYVVLYYHSIPAEDRESFARQMDVLLRWAQPVRADVAGPLEHGRRYASVTFDDGFTSVWNNAAPELTKRGIPATVFVPSAWLGQVPAWGNYSDGADSDETRVISKDMLASVGQEGGLSIASHSKTHPRIDLLDAEEAFEELDGSKRALEEVIGTNVGLFSFPHGRANDRDIELARKSGYDRVFSVEPTYGLRTDDEYMTGRMAVDADDWPAEFWLKLMGAYRWLPMAFRAKRLLRGLGR